MPYDVDAIRKKLRTAQSGRQGDPDEFKPEKVKDDKTVITYRFFILPPVLQGTMTAQGPATKTMDQFYVPNGMHWFNNKPYPCPRIWNGEECASCNTGFELYKKTSKDDKVAREQIRKAWMPSTYNASNIYFPRLEVNPEELRGKVKYFNAAPTVLDQWTECVYRENAGDPDDSKAFGVFYDEMAAFCYQLEVRKQGTMNSYKTSKFLANGGKSVPIAKTADGVADTKKIAEILAMRHDLFVKLATPDSKKLKELVASVLDGDDAPASGGFDHDDSKPATQQRRPPPETKPVSEGLDEELPFEPAATGNGKGSDEISDLLNQLSED